MLKPAVGFPRYAVSDTGLVYGRGGRRMTPQRDKDGYLYVRFFKSGRYYKKSLHRLVYETFVGPIPSGRNVCHNDGSRSNNSVANLRADTQKSNCADKLKHGTAQIGERHGNSIVSDALARKIKNRIEAAPRKKGALLAIARDLNVSRHVVYDMKRGRVRTWL